MGFWIAAFLIAAAVAALLLGALRAGGRAGLSSPDSDMRVYRDQIAEIDRDLARGVLTEAEAGAVRTEVSRRLLDADRRAAGPAAIAGGRPMAAALVIVLLLGGGAGLYALLGAAGMADLPTAGRIAALDRAARARPGQVVAEDEAAARRPAPPAADPAFLDLVARLRAALAERPDDLRGLELVAENEARLGNFAAARAAQERLVALKGAAATPDDLVMAIEIMVFGAGGYVSPEAEGHIARLLETDPDSGPGRYYAGLVEAQNGRPDLAFPVWRRLLETSPPEAPWVAPIRSGIEDLAAAAGVRYSPPAIPGPDAGDIARAGEMTEGERQAMIRNMVEGLADRLAADGGPAEDWARLVTALGVLGETDRARAIVAEARAAFAADPDGLATIAAAAARAGVAE